MKPQVLRYGASKGRWTNVIFGCGFLLLLFLALLQAQAPPLRIFIGWVIVGLLSMTIVFSTLNLLPGANCLELSPEGFSCTLLWFKRTIQWADVSGFGVGSIEIQNTVVERVGYYFVPESPHKPRNDIQDRVYTRLYGFEAVFRDTYGMTPREMAQLLNDRLEAWRLESSLTRTAELRNREG